MANKLKLILKETGFELFIDSPTNQQFAIIPNEMMKKLEKKVIFTHWEPYDNNHFVCRFVTSWATTPKDLDTLKRILQQCKTGK
jgi:threonine aldolase